MKRSVVFWILAFMITVASAYYQRVTGPTHPVNGAFSIHDQTFRYSLERSQSGNANARIVLPVDDPDLCAAIEWKRFRTNDDWTMVPMERVDASLRAELPNQPPAGKLQYRVIVAYRDSTLYLPSIAGTVIRFKGEVPASVLVIHVLLMFAGMLVSTRAGFEIFNPEPRLKNLVLWALGLLFVGGLILGPIVQKYAFGAYWTGWPFGSDLTDNKTFIAWFAWLLALVAVRKNRRPAQWALAAAIVTIIVFSIPHSVFGSELDYSKVGKKEMRDTLAQPRP